MASGAQHYQTSEELLAYAAAMRPEDYEDGDYTAIRHATAAEAQAHATLALAAATALSHLEEMDAAGSEFYDADDAAAGEWAKATNPNEAKS